MALIKDEWIIRKTSSISIDNANSYIRDQLDKKQDAESNLDTNDDYINNFFADLFDARDGSLYRIYSVGATNNSSVVAGDSESGDSFFGVVVMSDFLKQPDLADYRVETEIVQLVDGKLATIQIDEVIIG